MKKNILWILAAVLCFTLALPAHASDDTLALDVTPTPSAVDAFYSFIGFDQASTNQILDEVMAGSFSAAAMEQATAEAVASVLTSLTEVSSQEMMNYATEKALSKEQVRNAYYRALANVLRAEIRLNPASETRYQNIQIILDLFLNGDGTDEVISETRRVIRQSMTPQHATTIASDYKLPAGFVEFVIMDDDWDNDDWTDDTAWIAKGGYAGTNDYIATDDYLGTDNYDATDDYVASVDYDNTPDYNTPDNTPDYDDTPVKTTTKKTTTTQTTTTKTVKNTPDTPDRNTPDRNTPDHNTPDRNTPDNTPDYDNT